MSELALEVFSFILNKIGLFFSMAALVLSYLSYRNSKSIKRKSDRDALYKFKTDTLLKAREFEIAFQDAYDKVDGFIKELEKNTNVLIEPKDTILGEMISQRDSFYRQCVLDAKATCLYIIDNFDTLSEDKFIEYHKVFNSELERLKANNKRMDSRFSSLIQRIEF
ncbi:hypothetical protein CXH12_19145 [Citrobacter portucalensis]|uniref:hypothetical protein n=1 Tax=Citrobacter portucalensis TaxID=1639133 RepID=UPI000C9F0C8D|nr:hypothetical protein [Citrobacter portucalensis]PKQ47920.1 hypothetical protein CXH12_19145 [Citrobacter portucalensis]